MVIGRSFVVGPSPLALTKLPEAPEGMNINRVDVIVRLRDC